MGCCKTIERYLWFSFLSGSLVSEVCRCRVVENSEGRCWSVLMCGGALWEGTLWERRSCLCISCRETSTWERKVALTKRGNPLPTSEARGEDGGGVKSTAKRRPTNHCSQARHRRLSLPIHCRARIQACHSANRHEHGPTCRGLHR